MPFPCYIIIDTDCPNCQKLMEWKYFKQWLEYVRKTYHVQIIDKHTAFSLGLGEWACDDWGRLTYRIRTPVLWCMGHIMELVDDNCFRHDPKRGRVIDPPTARIKLWHATCLISRCFREYMRIQQGTGKKKEGKVMLTRDDDDEREIGPAP